MLGRELGIVAYGLFNTDQLVIPSDRPDGLGRIINYKSIYFELPIVEYRPYRAFSSHQSSEVLFQLFAGIDIPYDASVERPIGGTPAELRNVYSIGLRMLFDLEVLLVMRANLPAAALAASLLGGCAAQPLMPYAADTPPLVVVPAPQAGVQDKRARFREIYCAALEVRKDTLPDYRPCDQRSLAWASSRPVLGEQFHRSDRADGSSRCWCLDRIRTA